MKRSAVLLLLIFVSLSGLWAQTSTAADPDMTSTQFDMTGFPLWARDLRRFEIITFGSFPFAYFFSNFGVDLYRSAKNGWDRRYAPWPATAAGAIDKTKSERFLTIGVAAGGAVLIAVIDYGIVRYKRNRLEKESRNLPPGTPIIIRKPLYEEEAGRNAQDNNPGDSPPETETPAAPEPGNL